MSDGRMYLRDMSSNEPLTSTKLVQEELTRKLGALLHRLPTEDDWNEVDHHYDPLLERDVYSYHGTVLLETTWERDEPRIVGGAAAQDLSGH